MTGHVKRRLGCFTTEAAEDAHNERDKSGAVDYMHLHLCYDLINRATLTVTYLCAKQVAVICCSARFVCITRQWRPALRIDGSGVPWHALIQVHAKLLHWDRKAVYCIHQSPR